MSPADATDRESDAPPEVPPPREADLPETGGWERCHDVAEEDLRAFLRQEAFEGEVSPARIQSIDYEHRINWDEDQPGLILGATQRDIERSTGSVLDSRIRVYRDPEAERAEDPAEARARVLSTVSHEVGHTVWADASPETRAWYQEAVFGWEHEHQRRAGSVSDYAGTDAEEHFCEAYSRKLVDPEKLSILDQRRPEGHRLGEGLSRVRASAAQGRQA